MGADWERDWERKRDQDDRRHRRRRQIRSMFQAGSRWEPAGIDLYVNDVIVRCPPSMRGIVLRPGVR